jgi:hypothetical protein
MAGAVILVTVGIIVILAAEVGADRRGESQRWGRMTRVVIFVGGALALYLLLTRNG